MLENHSESWNAWKKNWNAWASQWFCCMCYFGSGSSLFSLKSNLPTSLWLLRPVIVSSANCCGCFSPEMIVSANKQNINENIKYPGYINRLNSRIRNLNFCFIRQINWFQKFLTDSVHRLIPGIYRVKVFVQFPGNLNVKFPRIFSKYVGRADLLGRVTPKF